MPNPDSMTEEELKAQEEERKQLEKEVGHPLVGIPPPDIK